MLSLLFVCDWLRRLGQLKRRIRVGRGLSTVRAGLGGGGGFGRVLRMRSGQLLNHCGRIGLHSLRCRSVMAKLRSARAALVAG